MMAVLGRFNLRRSAAASRRAGASRPSGSLPGRSAASFFEVVVMPKPPTQIRRSVISHVKDEPSRQDLAARLAERDARYDADDRTPGEQWLNDPPPGRSALASRKTA